MNFLSFPICKNILVFLKFVEKPSYLIKNSELGKSTPEW